MALSVSEQVKAARESEVQLSAAREVYRPVAGRGALLYFLVDSLPALDRVYYFSMANFVLILQKGCNSKACSTESIAIRSSVTCCTVARSADCNYICLQVLKQSFLCSLSLARLQIVYECTSAAHLISLQWACPG